LLGVEILTNILTEEQFRAELHDVASLFAQRGISHAAVAFGFTPDAPQLNDVGVRHIIPVADVPSFISERERTKGFKLGLYDCWIEPQGLNACFRFRNDRDVHFTSDSAELLDAVRAHWRAKGFNVYPDDLPKKRLTNRCSQPLFWRCASMSILVSVFSVVAQPRSPSGG
jgi:hypothetical protein